MNNDNEDCEKLSDNDIERKTDINESLAGPTFELSP